MTKTKTTHSVTAAKNPPLNASRYIGFYLTMLILSTVGTSFSLFNLIGIADTLQLFDKSPLFVIFDLVTVLVVLPVSIWALVLLWLKRPLGIWLKLSTYAVSVISYIVLLVTASPLIRYYTDQVLAEMAKSDQTISTSFIEGFTAAMIYGGLVLSIIVSIVFGLLWYFA